jgi:hypothetical protein
VVGEPTAEVVQGHGDVQMLVGVDADDDRSGRLVMLHAWWHGCCPFPGGGHAPAGQAEVTSAGVVYEAVTT